MAHKTLIGGTAYEITGGKTLVNGTAYSIKNGMTLVGGTAYEVGFSTIPLITIVNAPDMAFGMSAFVRDADDNELHSGNYEFPIGTVIECHVGGDTGYTGEVILNGEVVFTVAGSTGFLGPNTSPYDYTVKRDATITIQIDGTSSGKNRKGTIIITED